MLYRRLLFFAVDTNNIGDTKNHFDSQPWSRPIHCQQWFLKTWQCFFYKASQLTCYVWEAYIFRKVKRETFKIEVSDALKEKKKVESFLNGKFVAYQTRGRISLRSVENFILRSSSNANCCEITPAATASTFREAFCLSRIRSNGGNYFKDFKITNFV